MGKKIIALTVVMMFFLMLVVGVALAVPPGKTIVFEPKATDKVTADKVTYEGKTHADKGLKCNDCHTKIFPMKKSPPGTYTMEKMKKGEACGTCHNGEKSFKIGDEANCVKCHKK